MAQGVSPGVSPGSTGTRIKSSEGAAERAEGLGAMRQSQPEMCGTCVTLSLITPSPQEVKLGGASSRRRRVDNASRELVKGTNGEFTF